MESILYYLRDDSDAIIKEANRIGMASGEMNIMQPLHRERQIEALSPGQRLLFAKAQNDNRNLIRAISLSIGLIVLVLLIIMDTVEENKSGNHKRSSGEPVASGNNESEMSYTMGIVGEDMEMGHSMHVQVSARE